MVWLEHNPDFYQLDWGVFEQIVEMDEDSDPTHEFSRGIVVSWMAQTQDTIYSMWDKVEQRDLQGLSNAAHFCCGTSKTLGAKRIWPKFEEIHNLGMLKDASGKADQPDIDKALEDIKFRLVDIDSDYKYLRDSFQRVYSSDEKDG